jgi:hypothetical protein
MAKLPTARPMKLAIDRDDKISDTKTDGTGKRQVGMPKSPHSMADEIGKK